MSGWVAVHRRLADHPIWTGERFTRGQAWVDLILRAAWKDYTAFQGNRPIPVARGQVLTSQVKLAARWKWNRKTVRGFLEALKADIMVAIETSKETDTGYTLITICNYGPFQDMARAGADIENGFGPDIQTDIQRTSSGHPVPTENKYNKVNNIAGALPAPAGKDGKGTGPRKKPRKCHPETDSLLTEFGDLYKQKRGTAYLATFGRDKKLLGEMVTASGPEEVRARMLAFLTYGTKWARDTGKYDIPAFRAAWNEIGVLKARGDL
jgi:hypothetical protein